MIVLSVRKEREEEEVNCFLSAVLRAKMRKSERKRRFSG